MGVDHSNEGSKPGATVTPIRPEIQLADTTPFGSAQAGSIPPGEDADTWGGSPRRRMQAGEPTDRRMSLNADDHDAEESAAAGAGAPADGTYTEADLDGSQQPIRHPRPRPLGSWRGAASLALIALLGAAVALMSSGASTTSRQAAILTVAAAKHQPPAALSSLLNRLPTRTTVRRPHTTKTKRRSAAYGTTRNHRLAITRHRPSHAQPTRVANGLHRSRSSGATYATPVTSPPQTAQTPSSTSPVSSGGQATATPPTSTPPTAPAGPTGPSALIGAGHCGC